MIAWPQLTVVLVGAAALSPTMISGTKAATASSPRCSTRTPRTTRSPYAFLQQEHRQRFLQHVLAHDEEICDDPARRGLLQQLFAGLPY
ncbi:hypothetical protein NHG22_10615 [Streptomyces sp. ATE26]|uniref:hypothetical protein n=1 Tax=Streptomyces sp. ATE26 TaxID=2954237 RepID=UPI0024829065|nr:hypothetical protein [Streptomyces sp. ATE26]MDI1454263.1 hypothetical protein [Streptomyces sp. ATE26]